jgi:hypothetical protein
MRNPLRAAYTEESAVTKEFKFGLKPPESLAAAIAKKEGRLACRDATLDHQTLTRIPRIRYCGFE